MLRLATNSPSWLVTCAPLAGTYPLAPPSVPALADLGLPDIVLEQRWGLVVPAGTPNATAERVRTELRAALGPVEVREGLRMLAAEKQPGTAGEFSRFICQERIRWTAVAERAGLKPE